MSIVAGSLRSFWVPGLNSVAGKVSKGISGWIADEDFQFYHPLQPDEFTLTVSSPNNFLPALAADINRFTISSFESINNVSKNERLPRSTSWLIIKSYYAAFFASHALARMFGTMSTQFDRTQARSINKIAAAWNQTNGQVVQKGFYDCFYDGHRGELLCKTGRSGSGGVHEQFWNNFHSMVVRLSNDVLVSGSGSTVDNQLVSSKLSDLADNLCDGSQFNGNWLSYLRNGVNYAQRFGTWYPYADKSAYIPELFGTRTEWVRDPMSIDLKSHGDKEFRRFQATCNFLISACRVLVSEMSKRCSSGRSFHEFGAIALLNFMRPQGLSVI